MPQSIIRSRSMITRTLSRTAWEQIDDGPILQQDGVIKAVGTFEALRAANPTVPVIPEWTLYEGQSDCCT